MGRFRSIDRRKRRHALAGSCGSTSGSQARAVSRSCGSAYTTEPAIEPQLPSEYLPASDPDPGRNLYLAYITAVSLAQNSQHEFRETQGVPGL